jgi:hypothetical protein
VPRVYPKKDEYLDVSDNTRHWNTLRFAELTIYIALTGALLNAIIAKSPPLTPLVSAPAKIAGSVVTILFFVLQERTMLYRYSFIHRAAELEKEQINVDALLAYRGAVGRRTREIIRNLQPEVLDEVIDAALVQRARDERAFGPNAEWVPQRWEGKTKAFTLSWTVLWHSLFTLGECYVVRGLLGLPTI